MSDLNPAANAQPAENTATGTTDLTGVQDDPTNQPTNEPAGRDFGGMDRELFADDDSPEIPSTTPTEITSEPAEPTPPTEPQATTTPPAPAATPPDPQAATVATPATPQGPGAQVADPNAAPPASPAPATPQSAFEVWMQQQRDAVRARIPEGVTPPELAPAQQQQGVVPPVQAAPPGPVYPVQQAPAPAPYYAPPYAAPAAPQAPVAQPVPGQPTPEQVAAHRQQLAERAASVFTLSEEQVERVATAPEEVLPQLMGQVYVSAVEAVAQQVSTILPQIIDTRMQTQIQQAHEDQQFRERFFGHWAAQGFDLRPHEGSVFESAKFYRLNNPQATPEQFIQDVGALAILANQLQPHAATPQNGNPNGNGQPVPRQQQVAVPGFGRSMISAAGGAPPTPPVTGWPSVDTELFGDERYS